ncbi:ion transporter [Mycobacterium sp.]|uniref:ion transporter n=1 Tax=Mycobacterium sp. TaxID=1785 RepID=UPI003F97C338
MVAGAIIANVAVLVAGYLVGGHELAFELVHDAILAFFMFELGARLRAGGWRFLRRPFNLFDMLVILASALPVLGMDASLLRVASLARAAHLMRHLPLLRLFRFAR